MDILRPRLAARGIDLRTLDRSEEVDASFTGDKLRVSGKKDDLQTAIALLKKTELPIPLQFENFRD